MLETAAIAIGMFEMASALVLERASTDMASAAMSPSRAASKVLISELRSLSSTAALEASVEMAAASSERWVDRAPTWSDWALARASRALSAEVRSVSRDSASVMRDSRS